MNYSWANPSTGIREQVATKEEARLLAWEEVQKAAKPISFPRFLRSTLSVGVFEQEAAGWASKAAYEQLPIDPWPDGYAFSNPKDGARESYRNFANAAERIADEWPEHYNRTCSSQAPVDQVTIYRQRLAFEVRWDDPKPELPTPPVIPPVSSNSATKGKSASTAASIRLMLSTGTLRPESAIGRGKGMETDKMAFFIPTDYAPVIQELKQRLAMVETTIQVLEEIQNEEGVKPPAAGARPTAR